MLSLATPTSAHIASLHHHHRHQHQQHLSYAAAFLGHAHFLPPPPPPSWFLSPPSSSSSPAPSDGQAPGWKTSPPPDDEDAPSAAPDTEVDLMNGGGQQGPLPTRSGQVGHTAPPPADICSPYNGGESLRWLADVAAHHHRTPVSGTPPTSNQELYPIRPRLYAPPPLYVGLPPFYANPALPSTASYSAFYSPATMLHPARGGAFAGLSPPSHAMGRGGVCAPPHSANPPHQLAPPISFGDESPGGFRRFPPPSPTSPAFNAPPPPQSSTPPRKGGAVEGKEGSLKHRFLSSRTSSTGGNKSGLEDIKEEERGAVVGPPVSTPMRRRRGLAKRLLPESRSRLLYPAHFTRGSMIQLATGELKRVEDMRTDDFVASADASHHLKIDSSTLVRVDSRSITDDDEDDDADVGGSRQVALLGFSVGERRVQVTVEAALEHPFFVFGQGWSSCCPERTKTRYGLTCSKLQVGDVCVSLTHKTRPSTGGTSTPPPSCPSSSSDATPPDSCSRKRRWSAPAAEAESSEQTPPSAPPHHSST